MSAHVIAVVKACFAALRHICSVHRSLTRTTLLTLVHALVVTKVDYCSSVLWGIFGQLLQRLQSVFNAATHLVFSTRKAEHITALLCVLHWLKVTERIQFQLHVFAYCCLIGTAPSYLAANVGSRRRLRSASASTLVILSERRTTLSGRAFPVLLLERGMLFHRLFVLCHRCCSSAATRRRHCFSHHTFHHSVLLCDRL